MYIQSYQIHNVLNVYRRQLSQSHHDRIEGSGQPDTPSDAVTISAKNSHPSILEKVTANVLKKITNVEPGADLNQQGNRPVPSTDEDPHRIHKDNAFIFNTIVGDNRKVTRSIAVDTSRVLMNRLDELAKAAIDRHSE